MCSDADLTLPHPFARERAFVLMPWLDVDPAADITVDGRPRPVRDLLDELDQTERDGVRTDGAHPQHGARLMGPTRRRDLAVAAAVAAIAGYLAIHMLYRYFPPITLGPGCPCWPSPGRDLVGGIGPGRIRDGRIGVGVGRLHPLAVARTVAVAKASAWVGAVMLGWWLAVLAYLPPRRAELRVAAADTPGRWSRPSVRLPSSPPRCGCSTAASPRRANGEDALTE